VFFPASANVHAEAYDYAKTIFKYQHLKLDIFTLTSRLLLKFTSLGRCVLISVSFLYCRAGQEAPRLSCNISYSHWRTRHARFKRSWKNWKSHVILKWLFPGLEKCFKKNVCPKIWEKSWKCVIFKNDCHLTTRFHKIFGHLNLV